jgi:hypothetical protein
MAKLSQINRNKKREKMVAQYAARRAALKATTEDMSVPPEERFAAHFVEDAHPSPLRIVRPGEGLLPQGQAVAHCAARAFELRTNSRHDQGELVGDSIWR